MSMPSATHPPATGPLGSRFRARELREGEPLGILGEEFDLIVPPDQKNDRYLVGFAASPFCVREAQRLRFEVFNLELREGFSESYREGLDRDRFDDQMTHVVMLDRTDDRIIGTYRVQTAEQGLAREGIYSAEEYEIAPLAPYFERSVECGRACIAQGHRSFGVLHLLWRGIGAFMNLHGSRWLFGCCSLTTTDPDDGWRAMKTIRRENHLHAELRLKAQPGFSCGGPEREASGEIGEAVALPKLFHTYMKLGAKVISDPAIDRAFGTVDFLVLMDSQAVTLSSLDIVK